MRVVFDLDGTLANNQHRVWHIRDGRKDYHTFFKLCPLDLPIWTVIYTLQSHVRSGHIVEIWSGRSDQVRHETYEWLKAHGIIPNRVSHMRPAKDHRPDTVLKREWLNEARSADKKPDLIYEDRDRVVEMWRAEGIKCFQVQPGPF